MSDTVASKTARADPADDITGPPASFLVLAAACVLVGVVLVSGEGLVAHVSGYVSASVLTIVVIGLYRRIDLARRLRAAYVPRPAFSRVVTLVLVVGMAVSAVHVWAIATELAS